MILRSYHYILLVLFSVFLFVPAAWGGALWLYEAGTPDLGTASAGRAALAADASTAGTNPAGMTHLDRSQMLVAVQGLYINSRFDTEQSDFGGGDGGNAGGFMPSGSLHYVHRVTDDLSLGVAYEYADLGEAEMDREGDPLQGSLKGEYDPNTIHLFAVNLIWKF